MEISTAFCVNCITQASQLDAIEITHQGIAARNRTRISSNVSSSGSRDGNCTPHSSGSWTATSRTTPYSVDSSMVRIETEDAWQRQYQLVSKPSSVESSLVSQSLSSSMDSHKLHLVAQMSQLRLAAEQTYQITKENERVMNSVQ